MCSKSSMMNGTSTEKRMQPDWSSSIDTVRLRRYDYVGPYLDLAPLFELDGQDYYYQERHEILHKVKSALTVLQDMGIISGLKEVLHVGSEGSHTELQFFI